MSICCDCGKDKQAFLCLSCNDKWLEQAVRRGRVEELEKTIKELEGSLEFYECDYCKFEQPVVDKVMEELNEHINKLKKRLLELQGVEK